MRRMTLCRIYHMPLICLTSFTANSDVYAEIHTATNTGCAPTSMRMQMDESILAHISAKPLREQMLVVDMK